MIIDCQKLLSEIEKMKTPVEVIVEQDNVVEELDFVELGDVSEETKGLPYGVRGDTGLGLKF